MIRRLRRSPAALALATVIVVWLLPLPGGSEPQFASGWSLLLLVLLLALYRLRKALPFMHLAPVSAWRRVHIALGLLLPLMLLQHLGNVWPAAALQRLLLSVLLFASVSGLLLVWQARRMPARLTAAGGNVSLDEIPQRRAALRMEARQQLLEVAGGPMQRPYAEMLAALLPGGQGRVAPLPRSRPDTFSRAQWREISDLLQRAQDLDTQRRRQRAWRLLLAAHAGSSHVLLLLVLLHLLQAYRMLPQ